MLKIAVLDDDEVFGKHVQALLKQYIEVPTEILYFSTGTAFLKESEDTDILFLDIDMPKMNGMELAHELLKKSMPPIVVF